MSYPVKPSGSNAIDETNIFASSGSKIDMTTAEILAGYCNKNETQTPLTSEPESHRFNSFLYKINNSLKWVIQYAEALYTNKLELSGGTMTGAINMGNAKITNLANATNAQDAMNLQSVQALLAGVQAGMLGEVKYLSYPTIPDFSAYGYEVVEADGRALNRITYNALFTLFGETFGAGDGSTTFNIPDCRGVAIRGWDNGRGLDSGHAFGAYQADTLQNFTATFKQGARDGDFISGAIRYIDSPSSGVSGRVDGGSDANYTTGRVQIDPSITARTSTETRMKNISLYPVIRIK